MLLYSMPFLICFFLNLYLNRIKSIEHREKLLNKWYIVIIIYMILLCGLRSYNMFYHVGMDTNGYYWSYVNKEVQSFTDVFSQESKDKGYAFMEVLFSKLHLNFTLALVVFASMYIIPIGVFIYKYSKNILISIVIFVGLGLYTFSFSAIRQSVAMGICIIAYMLNDKMGGIKGILLFCASVWVAQTIHASAIVFLPVCIIMKLPLKKSILYAMIVCTTFAMLFKNQFSTFLINIASEVSESYEGYQSVLAQEANLGIKLYLLVLSMIVLSLVFGNKRTDNDNLIYMILCMLILFPAVQSGGAIMRIYYYYYIFVIVYFPNMIEGFKDNRDRMLIYTLYSIVFVIFFYTSVLQGKRLLPYNFFWYGGM